MAAVYLWWLTASSYLPGPPIWQIQAADLKDVINESINFWYVNIGLEAAGLPYVPAEAVSPNFPGPGVATSVLASQTQTSRGARLHVSHTGYSSMHTQLYGRGIL